MPKPSSIRPVVSTQRRLVTDRWTERQTDGQTHDNGICRASVCTLGPKTSATVVVVLKRTNRAMMRKAESGLSPTSRETGTPAAHVMTTL